LFPALQRGLGDRHADTLSLRAAAGALLCAGPLAERLGLDRWPPHAPGPELAALAHELVCLADVRNRLAHRAAGRVDEATEVGARAVRAGALVARLLG
jgi:hypothetical protein